MARVYSEDKVKKKLRSVMVYVEEMFNEVDSLTTRVVIDAKNLKIERAPARNNWSGDMRYEKNSIFFEFLTSILYIGMCISYL